MHGLEVLHVATVLPVFTVLTVLTKEILETAFAANDVLMEKETFNSLSSYFKSICPVLEELLGRDVNVSPATQQALESLQREVGRARSFVEMCKKKSRFYQLVNCRSIIKKAQELTRDVGYSLSLLSLANGEASLDIQSNVIKLKDQMLHAEYQASQQKLEVVDKIETGIKQHNTDQAFLRNLIKEIALAVGVPVEDSSEIQKELAHFIREKEEAAKRKEKEEDAFMEQIIALLSRADAARTPESIREEYRKYILNFYEELPPFETFRCPLSKEVMQDPVSVVTGRTYERSNIEKWFSSGKNTDPGTGEVLHDLSLKQNHKIRECIEEWEERNYCIQIRNGRRKLESGDSAQIKQALEELHDLCGANYKIRYWIAEEELVVTIVEMLKSNDKGIRRNSLLALRKILLDSDDNKMQFVESGGVELVVKFLARNIGMSKLAVSLLLHLVQPGLSGMPRGVAAIVCEKLSQDREAILLLATLLLNQEDADAACSAEQILNMLCDKDQNVVKMAKANWFVPLIERLRSGTKNSKLIMAKALGELEPVGQSLETIGVGAILPLVQMVDENLECKVAALRALQSLASCRSNKRRLAEEGGVPIVLDHLFSGRFPMNVRESAAAIFEKLVLMDGTTWLVDANGDPIDVGKTIHNLLELQGSFSSAPSIHKHVLYSLQGILSSPFGFEARRMIMDAGGITKLLPLLEHREPDVRNAVVQVLCCLEGDGAQEIAVFIMQKKLVGLFVRLLNHGSQDVQTAASGVLACLPQGDTGLTKELVEENALQALMHLVRHGDQKIKEHAIGAILRFTLSSDVELQKKVMDMEIYTALKGLIYSGTQLAKLRAAMAFRNFSESTMKLSTVPAICGWCRMIGIPSALCRVHGGQCEERTTFCLVKAEVVPELVLLVKDRKSEAAGAAVDALSTLVIENETLEKGVKLLHDEKAIGPVLELVSHGTELSKEKALDLLRKIFKVRSLAEHYGDKTRFLLDELATHGNGSIGRQAAIVLGSCFE